MDTDTNNSSHLMARNFCFQILPWAGIVCSSFQRFVNSSCVGRVGETYLSFVSCCCSGGAWYLVVAAHGSDFLSSLPSDMAAGIHETGPQHNHTSPFTCSSLLGWHEDWSGQSEGDNICGCAKKQPCISSGCVREEREAASHTRRGSFQG